MEWKNVTSVQTNLFPTQDTSCVWNRLIFKCIQINNAVKCECIMEQKYDWNATFSSDSNAFLLVLINPNCIVTESELENRDCVEAACHQHMKLKSILCWIISILVEAE